MRFSSDPKQYWIVTRGIYYSFQLCATKLLLNASDIFLILFEAIFEPRLQFLLKECNYGEQVSLVHVHYLNRDPH